MIYIALLTIYFLIGLPYGFLTFCDFLDDMRKEGKSFNILAKITAFVLIVVFWLGIAIYLKAKKDWR